MLIESNTKNEQIRMENNNLSDQYFNETKNLKEELERYKISYKIKKKL